MADLDKDIAQFEALLRRLEKEYDLFLTGQTRREPAETENAVLGIMRGWANRSIQNPTSAFRFNSLVARYNAFKTVWTRRQREREEGRGPAFGQRRPAAEAPRATGAGAGAGRKAEYLAVDPHREGRRLLELFDAYRGLREECGENVDRLQFESFSKALTDKVGRIRAEQGCDGVLIRVVKEEGRTRLVARPFRRRPGAGGGGGGA